MPRPRRADRHETGHHERVRRETVMHTVREGVRGAEPQRESAKDPQCVVPELRENDPEGGTRMGTDRGIFHSERAAER